MKRFLLLAAMAAVSAPALAGVSVNIGEPGFYGRIDIGNFPQPRLVYPEPVVIQRVPVGVVREPIYVHVPAGHEKNWRKHCRHYNACGQPVYFVHDDWYNREYVPRYRERHRDDRGRHHGDGRGDDRGESRDHGRGNR
jgi:hypothetical protein